MTNLQAQLANIRPAVVKNTQVKTSYDRQTVDASFIVQYESSKVQELRKDS
jgi:hypothetical protein